MKQGLTNYEKETIITFNDGEDEAQIYTCNKTWIKTLAKLAQKDSRVSRTESDEYSQTYVLPKKAIKVRLSVAMQGEKLKKARLQAQQRFHNAKK